jgi:hypothetical protein
MGMRNSTVGTDMVLGKTILKRHGVTQWLVGEVASSQLGSFWGTAMGLLPEAKGKNAWVSRGVLMSSLAWMVDMGIGARSIPRAVQGDVSPKDALMWWAQHLIFGLFTSYCLDGNPEALTQMKTQIGNLVRLGQSSVPVTFSRDERPADGDGAVTFTEKELYSYDD